MGVGHGIALVAAALGVTLVAPRAAWAYVDPGHGALVWQVILATLFGALYYLRRFLARLRRRRDSQEGHQPLD